MAAIRSALGVLGILVSFVACLFGMGVVGATWVAWMLADAVLGALGGDLPERLRRRR